MATVSNNGGFGNMFDEDTIYTNKGPKPKQNVVPTPAPVQRKCEQCDNTVQVNESVCSQCFSLTESAKPILLD